MSCRHISRDDRVSLAALLRAGNNFEDIGKLLAFDPTAISREVKANGGRSGYSVRRAQKRADLNRLQANQCHRKIGADAELTETVICLLELKWSPEQIAGRMKVEQEAGLISSDRNLTSTATIYNWVNPKKELHHLLPRGHSKYRRKHGISDRERKRKELEIKRNISTRPDLVETRDRLGDWEGDTIIGAEKKARILTHTDRKSGLLLAEKTENGEAAIIRKATNKSFKKIPKRKKNTFTYDNGVEFSDWEQTEQEIKTTIYFANAYHSWERGTSENTNGLVRRDYPKGTLFDTITTSQLAATVHRINHRPRKRLGYKTPHEVFYETAIRTLI